MMLRGRRVDAETVGAYLRWRRWTHRYANLRTPRFFTGAGSSLVIGGKASVAIGPGFVTGRQFTGIWFGDLRIGRDVFFNESCHLATFAAVTIGDGCLFGEKVSIHDENHRFGPEYDDDPRTIPARGLDSRPIVIGDRVWVGAKATVLGGAVIGDDAVIGAHAVVTGTIPPRTLAVGIPARPVRSW